MKTYGKMFLTILCCLITLLCLNSEAFAKKKRHHKAAHTKPQTVATVSGNDALTQEINRLIANVSPNLNVGVIVKSMRQDDVMYTRDDKNTYVPASILKIFTAESALLYLGSDYRFSTVFATDAKSTDQGVVNGNVYLVHSGDPSLTYYGLVELMEGLKAKHIQQINGNVYIDTSAYDQEIYGPGWVSSDTQFCYAAPISASIINHNCMVLQVSPSKAVGGRANIIQDGNFTLTGVENEVVTKPRGTRSCTIRLGTDDEKGITVSGCMPKGHYSRGVSSVVTNIVHYNRSLIKRLFQSYGIQIKGDILPGTAANKLPVLAQHNSKPLRDLISDMLKKSDNIIAGSLFKKMGEVYSQQPGSWQNGSLAVKQILRQKMGVDTSHMTVLDGSGLSRDNQISPNQMMQVLDFAYHNNVTNSDFLSALPIAGIDGTLKHRMKNIKWKVRAKTGTMSGVVALAGYAMSKNKEPLAFVIIINGRMGMGWKYKEMENNIMTVLTNYSRG